MRWIIFRPRELAVVSKPFLKDWPSRRVGKFRALVPKAFLSNFKFLRGAAQQNLNFSPLTVKVSVPAFRANVYANYPSAAPQTGSDLHRRIKLHAPIVNQKTGLRQASSRKSSDQKLWMVTGTTGSTPYGDYGVNSVRMLLLDLP